MRGSGRKQAAGGRLLVEMQVRFAAIGMAAGAVLGCALGVTVGGIPLIGKLTQAYAGWPTLAGSLGVMGLTLGLTWLALHRTEATRGRGSDAERRVGDRIEHALVRWGCAFAHDVKEALDGGGNVDHVVLTGAGVWVVKTTAAWLDEGPFQDALQEAAANVQRVRRKLDRSDVAVRAALVAADNREPFEADRDWEGEPVTVFRVVSFWRRLQEECDDGEGGIEDRQTGRTGTRGVESWFDPALGSLTSAGTFAFGDIACTDAAA